MTRPAPRTFAAEWGARGWVTELGGGPVHWARWGTDGGGTPIVFVHGLGGSHLNWVLVAPELTRDRAGYALDLRGFGLTPGFPRDTSIQANVRLLAVFLREVVRGPAILVGNSMGGLIATTLTADRPEAVRALVLVDPALPPPRRPDLAVAALFATYAIPGVGEFAMRAMQARSTPEAAVRRVLELCFADPSRVDPAMLAAAVALAKAREPIRGKEESFLGATRSLVWTLARADRHRAMQRRIDVPVLLISGEADRLVPIAAARAAAAANPAWDTLFLPGVGHTPQLETPSRVVEAVTSWLARTVSTAGH